MPRRRRRQTLPALLIGSLAEAAVRRRENRAAKEVRRKDDRGEIAAPLRPARQPRAKSPPVTRPPSATSKPKKKSPSDLRPFTRVQVPGQTQNRFVVMLIVMALTVPFFTIGGSRQAIAAGTIAYGGNIGTMIATCSTGSDTVNANEDAELQEEQGSTSFGSGATMSTNASTVDAVHRSVVKFPLPTIPAGCQPSQASLRVRSDVQAPGRSIAATRVAAPWNESSVTWHTQPATTGSSVVVPASSNWMTWDVTTQVEAMYSGNNYGFRLSDAAETSANSTHTFHTSESGFAPELVVVWEASDQTSTTLTTTGSAPKGSSIVLSYAADDDAAGAVSASDSAGNAYLTDADASYAGQVRTVILSAHNVEALPAGSTITVSHPGTGARGLSANFFTGLSESGAVDASNGQAAFNNAPNSGGITTSDPNELLVSSFGIAGTAGFTLGGGFTAMPGVGGSSGRLATQYSIVSSTGSYSSTASLTASSAWAGAIASYRMDTTIPVVQIDTPVNNGLATATPTFSGTSSNGNSDSETVKLKLYAGLDTSGTPLDVVDVTRAGNGSWTHDYTTPLGDGVYTVQVEQEDLAQNVGTSGPITFTVDTLVPDPPTVVGPAPDPGNDDTVSWQFGGEPGGTYECSLSKDGNVLFDYTACVSPENYTLGDGDGIYTFRARQIDIAGNVGNATLDDYVLDTQAPEDPVITGPDPDPGNTTNVAWSFTTEPGADAECRLMYGAVVVSPFGPCTSPANFALVDGDGTYSFSVRQIDRAGNASGVASDDHELDTDVPTTTLDSGPSGLINYADVSFGFSSNDPTATFECNLDNTGFSPCASPMDYTSLGDGLHTFEVRALDDAGNVDGTPDMATFNVDTGAPPLSIDNSPNDPGSNTNVSWSFTTEAGATVECELTRDGNVVSAFSDCSSGSAAYNLGGDGLYNFTVRATDLAGNTSTASDSYLLDTVAPGSQASSTPLTSSTAMTIAYSTQETGSGVAEVELWVNTPGAGSYVLAQTDTSGSGSMTYNAVDGAGAYKFYTRARDAAGNYEGAPGNFDTQTVLDTDAPIVNLDSAPSDPTSDTFLNFSFSSADPTAAFSCSFTSDGSDAYVPCSSPASYVSPNVTTTYTFKVVASDPAGNVGPAATWTFTYVQPVVTTEPPTTEPPTTEPPTTEPPTTEPPTTEPPTTEPPTTEPPTTEPPPPPPTTEPPSPPPPTTPAPPPPPPPPTEEPPAPPPPGGGGTTVRVEPPEKTVKQPVEKETKEPKKAEPQTPVRDDGPPPPAPEDPNRIAELAKMAVQAVKTFAFPLLLAILVIIFLLVQHWIDKKDPKLAMAPVHSNHDLARFG